MRKGLKAERLKDVDEDEKKNICQHLQASLYTKFEVKPSHQRGECCAHPMSAQRVGSCISASLALYFQKLSQPSPFAPIRMVGESLLAVAGGLMLTGRNGGQMGVQVPGGHEDEESAAPA